MTSTLHLLARQTKALLIHLLLTASPHQDSLADVVSGRADALEPTLIELWSLYAINLHVRALVLRPIEYQDETAILPMRLDTDEEAYILLSSIGEAWGNCDCYGAWSGEHDQQHDWDQPQEHWLFSHR